MTRWVGITVLVWTYSVGAQRIAVYERFVTYDAKVCVEVSISDGPLNGTWQTDHCYVLEPSQRFPTPESELRIVVNGLEEKP